MASCWKSAQSCLGDTGSGGAFCGCGGCLMAPPASLTSFPASHHSDPHAHRSHTALPGVPQARPAAS